MLRARTASESGFTLTELLVATAIFFIAFTSITYLALANTLMGVRAKEKATMVNAANSYIEIARQWPYASVGTPSGDPAGTLAPVEQTDDGYTIRITPAVSWVDDPHITGPENYKKLTIQVSCRTSESDAHPMVFSSEAMIKAPDTGSNPNALPPTINASLDSPKTGEVVIGTRGIGASAHANGEGVALTSMNFYCDGVPMLDQSGQSARWALNAADAQQTFSWYTPLADVDGGQRPDGPHTIRLEAWDTNGRQSYVQWQVIVDNAPPSGPVTMTAEPAQATLTNLSWSECWDGIGVADHYALEARSQTPAATGSTLDGWEGAGSYTPSSNSQAFTTLPFSRYHFTVSAVGPLPASRTSTSSAECVSISRPAASGTYANVAGTHKTVTSDLTIALTRPTFPYDASTVTNTLYRSSDPSMAGATAVGGSGDVWQWTDSFQTSSNAGQAARSYYQVKSVITPLGYDGGTPVTVWSQVVANPTAIGSGQLETVRW